MTTKAQQSLGLFFGVVIDCAAMCLGLLQHVQSLALARAKSIAYSGSKILKCLQARDGIDGMIMVPTLRGTTSWPTAGPDGVGMYEAQKLMGHSSVAKLKRMFYRHFLEADFSLIPLPLVQYRGSPADSTIERNTLTPMAPTET